MLDLTLLRIVRRKEDYLRIARRIPDTAVDKQTATIIADFGKYFDRFPEHEVVDNEVFLPMFRAWHPSLKDEQRTAFEAILTKITKDVTPEIRVGVMRDLLELRLATEMGNLALRFSDGEVKGLMMELQRITAEFKADLGVSEVRFIDTDIDVLLTESSDDVGLRSRLSCINLSMRPLQPGDFGIIAGRPDKGKTSYISSEVTYWAPQLPSDKNIVWLNNEGLGRRIIPRIYQAALGVNRTKLMELSNRGLLKKMYAATVGRIDKIRVIDIHGMDNYSVQQLVEANNAGVVIYDMLDNVRGFGDAARTDLGLERMYQWAREYAVHQEHVAIATSQISNDGDNLQYPTLGMLKDSKTGKQGACDFQLMIGALTDPGYAHTRFLSLPKNKLCRDDGPRDPRCPVIFEAALSRYKDLDLDEAADAAKE